MTIYRHSISGRKTQKYYKANFSRNSIAVVQFKNIFVNSLSQIEWNEIFYIVRLPFTITGITWNNVDIVAFAPLLIV